jgi:hypothetical protein
VWRIELVMLFLEMSVILLPVQLFLLFSQWVEDVVASYEGDEHVQAIVSKLVVRADSVPHFTFQSGLLRYKKRIWVGNNTFS